MPVAGRIIMKTSAVLTGIALLLSAGCAAPPPSSPRPAPKESAPPAPTEMSVRVTVKDDQGRPLKNAVVYAVQKERAAAGSRKSVVVITNGAFDPFVLPVQVGTRISVQNRDTVQHHVYSISAAKKIDVALKKGASTPSFPIDKAGPVILGCAIHDRMVGYVYAVETAHFARTNEEGAAVLSGLPYQAVDIRVWHPSMKGAPEEHAKHITPPSLGRTLIDFIIPLQGKASRKGASSPVPPRKKSTRR